MNGAADAPLPGTGDTGIPFRMRRVFSGGTTPSTEKAYRVESTELLSEVQALQALRDLGSPYQGRKYDDAPPAAASATSGATGKRMRAAVVLFLETDNGLDPAQLAQAALYQSGLLKDGLTVRLHGEEHRISITGAMEAGMALGNGYLWASVTSKGFNTP